MSVDCVAHFHVVSRNALGNRARSASDPEKPAHHFLPGADLGKRAVPPWIEIDLERLGMGIDRFLFHGMRMEVYQESRRSDSYMFVKSECFTATARAGSRRYSKKMLLEMERSVQYHLSLWAT